MANSKKVSLLLKFYNTVLQYLLCHYSTCSFPLFIWVNEWRARFIFTSFFNGKLKHETSIIIMQFHIIQKIKISHIYRHGYKGNAKENRVSLIAFGSFYWATYIPSSELLQEPISWWCLPLSSFLCKMQIQLAESCSLEYYPKQLGLLELTWPSERIQIAEYTDIYWFHSMHSLLELN